MKTKEIQELLEFFGREQACYTSLLDLSRQQRDLILARDMEGLLEILGQKQQILGRVSQIESHLKPFKARWSALRAQLTADDRSVLDSALATVEELLAELIALEQECENGLQNQMTAVQNEMDEVSRAGKVEQTYAPSATDDRSTLLDLAGT